MDGRIDPWGSQGDMDYARLRDQFGIAPFEGAAELPNASSLLRRGVVFGHRGFDHIQWAIDKGEPWAVMTGLMPSGPMHLGHKMVIDQVAYFQSQGADVTIGIADLEAFNTRGLSMEDCEDIALNEYVVNELAIGLNPERTRFYFQSRNRDVLSLATILARKVNWSTMEALYGFTGDSGMGKVMSPLIQAADILHVQLPQHGGARPTLVPVGVDQDPHIRLTRDLAQAFRLFSMKREEDGRLGIYVKAEEGDSNLRRIAKRLGVDEDKVVKELFDRLKPLLKQLGATGSEKNVPYRALYASGLEPTPAVDVALARFEQEMGEMGFVSPAATYHRLMTGLTGGKMSSSRPESCLRLKDTPEVAEKNLKRAVTGGRQTADEQRELGGRPEECPVYELYVYHLKPDDEELARIHKECSTGEILCGHCKMDYAIPAAKALLEDLERGRKKAQAHIEEVVEE